jgi:hypothetical protein
MISIHVRLLAMFLDYEHHSLDEIKDRFPDAREVTRRIRELHEERFGQYTVDSQSRRGFYRILRDEHPNHLIVQRRQALEGQARSFTRG